MRAQARRLAVATALLAAASCARAPVAPNGAAVKVMGAAKPAPASVPSADPSVDAALELARMLPAGADRCVVTRTSLLPSARRTLFAPISQAEPFAWLEGLDVVAYATAMRSRGETRASSVSVLRFRGDARAARQWIDAHAGLELRWDDPGETPCALGSCPLVAKLLDAHTVRLLRGPWRAPAQEKGSERVCLALAELHRDAFEVAGRRGVSLFADGPSDLPIETRTYVVASELGAAIVRDDLMATSDAAERLAGRDPESDVLGGALSRGLELGATRSQQDLLVHTALRVRWDDLALARADARRNASADRYARSLGEVHADSELDFADVEAVLRELAARQKLAADSSADPEVLRAELAAFLDRALALHPADARLASARAEFPEIPGMTAPGGPAIAPP